MISRYCDIHNVGFFKKANIPHVLDKRVMIDLKCLARH